MVEGSPESAGFEGILEAVADAGSAPGALTAPAIRASLPPMAVQDLFALDGRTAIVTGGSRGIGRAMAEGLAEAGAHVIVASRKAEACEEAAHAIVAAGGGASAIATDVADPDSGTALVEGAIAATGRVDVLVNNAGRAWAAESFDYPLEGWDRVFALNVRGAFWLSRQVARHLRERRAGGSILNVSSLSAVRGASDAEQAILAYPASKGALEALTRDLAVKWAPFGIRVNAIEPGPFDTDMFAHIKADPELHARHDAQVPLGRTGQPDDVKGVAVFLASDAAAYVTGAILRVDGGVAAVYPVRKGD